MDSEGFSPGQPLKLWLAAGDQQALELHVEAVPASSEAAEQARPFQVLPLLIDRGGAKDGRMTQMMRTDMECNPQIRLGVSTF